jgi:hypothetical protein
MSRARAWSKPCPAFALTLFLPLAARAADAPAHAYVGVEKCAKTCHSDEKTGNQHGKWLASPHAKAWEALASDKAKEFAKAKGIDDPQKADACVKCHVTGFGAPPDKLTETYKKEEGVGCESCHGAGADYKKLSVMKDLAKSKAAGLEIPTEATCKKCHNEESPSYKPFDFAKFSAEIAHPNPEKAKK